MLEQETTDAEPTTVVEVEFAEPVVEEETEPDTVLDPIEGGGELRASTRDMAASMEVRDYKGVGTNLNHGHDRDKHDARDAFGVTDELAENYLYYDPADHAAPHELLARKDEFVNGDVEVFSDTSDTDDSRWNKIERAAEGAPIPDKDHRTLDRIAAHEA